MLRLEQVNGKNVWDILKLTVEEDQLGSCIVHSGFLKPETRTEKSLLLCCGCKADSSWLYDDLADQNLGGKYELIYLFRMIMANKTVLFTCDPIC